MRIPKLLLTFAMASVCAVTSVRAGDTPAQAAARAALMEKLQALGVETNAAPPIVVTAAGAKTALAPAPAKPVVSKPVKPKSQPVLPRPTVAPVAIKPVQPEIKPAQPAPPPPAPVVVATPPAAPTVAPAAPAQPAAAPANYPGKDLGMTPITAPALPIAPTKEAQLETLLIKYKADQITPQEYHDQRAAILAQPDAMTH